MNTNIMETLRDINRLKNISKNENNEGSITKYQLFNYERELEYTTKLYRRKINKLYPGNANFILLLKLLIYMLLLPIYFSKKNSFSLRKLNSLQIISIEFYGEGILNYISRNSKIHPKYIYVGNYTFVDYEYKSFDVQNNKTRNLTMKFNYNSNTVVSFYSLFSDMTYLTKVDLSKFDLKINDMVNMFKNCKSLEYVNFGNIDTSSVTSMENMFYGTGLKYLDLSKFDTSLVTNMKKMFSESKNLLYLNLNNFQTNKVTTMYSMFDNCRSLQFLNLYSFEEKSSLEISNIFLSTKNDLVYCVNSDKAPKIAEKLRTSKTTSNSCENDCFQDSTKLLIPEKSQCIGNCEDDGEYIYEHYNLCYDHPIIEQNEDDTLSENVGDLLNPNNEEVTEDIKSEKSNNEIMENCSAEDFFKGLCKTDDSQTISTEQKDNMISNIVDNIINGNLNSLLNEIVSGEKEDFYIKEDDIIFQITTTDNQNNNEYNNVSTINLGECEDTLKGIYGIDPNDSLIILKIDYFMEGLKIPIIGYEVFHPKNKSKLNLDYCKDFLINYNIPVSINEDEIEKYDPNSEYYNDECSVSTSEDGTDMTLSDRQKEYNDNNMSLCENKCNFTEYNISSKKSVCMCEIKSKIYTISEILESKETVSKDFNIENTTESSSSSINLMKCYNTVFSKFGLLKNLGNYILLLMIVVFSVSSIFFYKVGYVLLDNDIKQILLIKEKNEENINIYNYTQKKDSKDLKQKKKKKKKKNKKTINHLAHPNRKSVKKSVEVIDSVNTGKDINIHKSFSKIEFRENKKFNNINNIDSPPIKDKIQDNKITSNIIYTDYELNFFSYKEALEKDKRDFKQYYISLIRAKHPLIFSFIPIKDYNSMIIKVDIFLIGFGVIYAMNALFFTEATIHQIYKDKGNYNLAYFLPKTFLSFFVAHIFITAIRFIFLSERNILEVKRQETRNQAADQVDRVKKRLIIKYIIFYIAGVLFLILFWYYLSSFGAVYQNSQVLLIVNTFLSSAFSLIYPFVINIIPAVIRKFSLNTDNREIFYKANKIIQLI